MKSILIGMIMLMGLVFVSGTRGETITVFTAGFEDGEVNPGVDYGVVGNSVNTIPYPATQSEYFNHDMVFGSGDDDEYGWEVRAAGFWYLDGAKIINTESHSGQNCADMINRFLRSNIIVTLQANTDYAFSYWYLVPTGRQLAFTNKVVIKDQTNEYYFHLDDNTYTTTAGEFNIWYQRVISFNTNDHPGWGHTGEEIQLRFGMQFSGGEGYGAYTDDWLLTATTMTEMLVEDFVGYEDSADLLLSWDDGSSNSTGSTISMEPLGQIMQLDYDNSVSPYYSEASMDFTSAQNWTGDLKYMEIYLFGDADNGEEPLYVELSDSDSSAIVICPDSQAVLQSHKGWNINLAEFSSNGIDLTDVVSVAVGCGDKQSPQAGGTGTIYFDSIKLFASDCVEGYKPAADFTGDCTVNMDDLYEMLKVWLLGDYEVNATAPNGSGLIAYYTFDEPTGTTANDSSDNDYHATVDVSNGWDAGGYLNGCLDFDGSFGVTVPVDVFNDINQQLTIAAWLTLADANDIVDGEIPLMFGAGPASPDPNQWDVIYTEGTAPDPYTGQWLHVAVTKDSNVMNVYYNGLLVGQLNDASSVFDTSGAGVTRIGANASGMTDYHQGKMDEVRIYDYALSQEEVVYLALGSSGNLTQPMQPVLSPIDPVTDGIINLKDFAELAQLWLEERLWP